MALEEFKVKAKTWNNDSFRNIFHKKRELQQDFSVLIRKDLREKSLSREDSKEAMERV